MYTPLYIKTDYSLLSSLIKIDDLITKLKDKHITSCAICDNNMFGVMEFIKKCSANSIKPLIGLEINIADKVIILYAKNYDGYLNMCKIERIKQDEDLTFEILKSYISNLVVVCFEKEIFDELSCLTNDLFIGVSNKKEEEQITFTNNVVYANKTLYLEQYQYKYLPYVFMIRDGKTISDGIDFVYQYNYLKDCDEVCKIVSSRCLNNTLKISDMCDVVFLKNLFMPKFDKDIDASKYLSELANKGLRKRLNNQVPFEYQTRLDYELDVIKEMHFEDYFLVVYDYIRYAKQNDILVGPGRGSAAGSLVCFCLGITDIDPLKYNLLFERFLNKDRVTLPDIDTDFPDESRDKVINYVKEKYGTSYVSGIVTFGTLKSKQAMRDVGRVLNISLSDIDYLCKRINDKETLKEFKKRDKEASNFINNDEKIKMMFEIASLIEDNKRHTSIHAAGIVISKEKINNVVPVLKNDEIDLTEYTMEYLEELGLIKMDFLGIRNLSIIKDVLESLKKYENINVDFNKIPLDDEETYYLFQKGETTGVFQFESEGMKRFLKDLKPNCFTDISNAIAMYRPGPASNIPLFIKRKNNLEKIDYIDPSLEPILKDTYGIIIYQEQIMQIANKMANFSMSEADILRRAMSKKKLDILKVNEEKFINNSIKNGYSKEISKKVYDSILAFANYGFNKSHSVAYSTVAYKMAYLKCHYPKYFYGSLLKGVVGSDVKTFSYLQEVKKMGIKILPPDINLSEEREFKVLKEGILLPLASIRSVGGVIANAIVKERLNENYKSIFDFLVRTYKKINNKKVLQSLIYAHCFDNLNYSIATLANNLDELENFASLASDLGTNIEEPELTIYNNNIDEVLEQEKEIFGFYLTSHKTEKYKLNYKVVDLSEIKNYFNRSINVIISVDKIKTLKTKNNDEMAFITGSDNTGSVSLTAFPQKYQEFLASEISKHDILLISGRVEKRYDEYQVIINNFKRLNNNS